MLFRLADGKRLPDALQGKTVVQRIVINGTTYSLQLVEQLADGRVEVTSFNRETPNTTYINRTVDLSPFLLKD